MVYVYYLHWNREQKRISFFYAENDAKALINASDLLGVSLEFGKLAEEKFKRAGGQVLFRGLRRIFPKGRRQ